MFRRGKLIIIIIIIIITRAHAHAHLYHHLHSRFAYPLQGHPPCRHMHQLPPLLGLPSSTTTPPSQSQTHPLAAQQQHWLWELRGTGNANPRTRPRREVRLLLPLRRVSTATWNDDMRGFLFFFRPGYIARGFFFFL